LLRPSAADHAVGERVVLVTTADFVDVNAFAPPLLILSPRRLSRADTTTSSERRAASTSSSRPSAAGFFLRAPVSSSPYENAIALPGSPRSIAK
jgi:hypothetical protein